VGFSFDALADAAMPTQQPSDGNVGGGRNAMMGGGLA